MEVLSPTPYDFDNHCTHVSWLRLRRDLAILAPQKKKLRTTSRPRLHLLREMDGDPTNSSVFAALQLITDGADHVCHFLQEKVSAMNIAYSLLQMLSHLQSKSSMFWHLTLHERRPLPGLRLRVRDHVQHKNLMRFDWG